MALHKGILGLFAMMILALSAVVSKFGLREFDPLMFTLLRFVVVLPAIFFVKRPAISWPMLIAITLTLSVGHLCLTNIGLSLGASASTYVLIQQSGSIFALLFAYLLLRHTPSVYDLLGIALGIFGIYTIFHANADANMASIVILICSAALWGLGSILVKKANTPSFATSVWSVPFAVPYLAVPLSFTGNVYSDVAQASLVGWGSVFFCGWVSMMGAGAILFYLLRTEPISKVMPLYTLVPLFGTLFSCWFLEEQITSTTLIGGAWILLGVVVSQYGAKLKSALFKGQLKMTEEGAILLVAGSQSTSVPGVFAAGDVTTSYTYGQAAIAAGDGMKAGYDVVRYLKKSQ